MDKLIQENVDTVAERFGISRSSVRYWDLDRPMTELGRQVLVNRIKHVREPHNQPILRGVPAPLSLAISETEDTISITIPKRPIGKMSTGESSAILAVQRAGGAS